MRLTYSEGSAGPRTAGLTGTPGCQLPLGGAVIFAVSTGGSAGSWAAAISGRTQALDMVISVTTRRRRNIVSSPDNAPLSCDGCQRELVANEVPSHPGAHPAAHEEV